MIFLVNITAFFTANNQFIIYKGSKPPLGNYWSQIQEGLRAVLRAGMWNHFACMEDGHLARTFSLQPHGKQRGEFMSTKNELVRSSLVRIFWFSEKLKILS